MATTGKESPEAKNPTPTPQLGEYGYNPFFADWLIGECQNLHRFGDFDENGAYFIQIDDLLDAYRKHPKIEKNGWDTHYFGTLGEPSDGLGWSRFFKKTLKKRLTEKPPPRTKSLVFGAVCFFK